MCGIAGIWTENCTDGIQSVQLMNAAQRHRGPDDDGLEVIRLPRNGHLILGHRRLSILDLSPLGHQPMVNPQNGDWITFNGEIYNYRGLRKELELSGIVFEGGSDTEVLLKGLGHWGIAGLSKLKGMYSFAYYVAGQQKLYLVRDPFGIKPLYYSQAPDGFVFASEVQAIDRCGLVKREIDRRAVAGLLAFGSVQGPLVLTKGVRSLEPGTYLELNLQNGLSRAREITAKKYWAFPLPNSVTKAREDILEELHGLLRNAVREHLVSDVPVGVFLSSGLDSTAIAAISGEVGAELRSFTVSVADYHQFDENPIAEHTAARVGFRHNKIAIPESLARGYVATWINSLDQPSMDGLNTFIISSVVRQQGIAVALSGLGGDEVFGGYPSFKQVPRAMRWLRALQWLPIGVKRILAQVAFGLGSEARRKKAIELVGTKPDIPSLYFRRRRLLSDQELNESGLNSSLVELTDHYQLAEAEPDCSDPRLDDMGAISRLELQYYMSNMLLRDTDVCGMAHGLEIRVPFLDRDVVEFVLSLAGAFRMEGGSKGLLRSALGKILPDRAINLPKRGFSLPQAQWMAGPLRSLFGDGLASLKTSGLVEPGCINRVWDGFVRNPDGPEWSRSWVLGVLGHWYSRWSKLSSTRKNSPVPPN